ncbi:MAG: AraC family transcriptional regulator [Deltaproteobacteria bacterium]|nr:AraC family transcriptional regulator [Deltaproteobacteria bacterium]
MKQFFDAIDFAEKHLCEKLSVQQIAEASSFSRYHFCRMFRVLVGESVMEYVRKRRLSIAAERLLKEDVRLIDLAVESQFESQEAFTRAFKNMFQVTPGEYRKFIDPVRLYYRQRFDSKTYYHLKEGVTMEPKIVGKPAFKIVGMLENHNQDNAHQIPELWTRFVQRVMGIPNRKGTHYFGVSEVIDLKEASFNYIACVEVDDKQTPPEGMVYREIPANTYAVFTHTNRTSSLHDSLQETLQYIWGTWIPKSDYVPVKAPDFELYDERFNPMTMRGEIDICVPIKRK